jgi:hypothetical protein
MVFVVFSWGGRWSIAETLSEVAWMWKTSPFGGSFSALPDSGWWRGAATSPRVNADSLALPC